MVALAILVTLAAGACSRTQAKAAAPSSHCADLVAKAVTSYANTKGSGHCLVGTTAARADSKLAAFTADPAPVFDHIIRPCGYHPSDHTFTYLASNATDGAAGRIIVLVDDSGWVLDVAKHLDREPGVSIPLGCPASSDTYSFP